MPKVVRRHTRWPHVLVHRDPKILTLHAIGKMAKLCKIAFDGRTVRLVNIFSSWDTSNTRKIFQLPLYSEAVVHLPCLLVTR